jgi:hypothetical protein
MNPEDIPVGTVGLVSKKDQMSRDERLALRAAERSRGRPLESDAKLEQQVETRERMAERLKLAEEKEKAMKAKQQAKEDAEFSKQLDARLGQK